MPVVQSAIADIALATFNGARFLPEMLASFETQSHLPGIVSVSDDRSDDATLAIVGSRPDVIIYRVATNQGTGVVKNFETALKGCEGEYVLFADQDDTWTSDKIEKLLERMLVLEADSGKETPTLVFSDLRIVDADLETISPSFYLSSLKRSDCHHLSDFILDGHIPGCAMMLNKALVHAVLPFPNVTSHDWWVQLVAAAIGRIGYVDKPLVLYRQHGSNTVGLGRFGRGFLNKVGIGLSHPFKFLSQRSIALRRRVLSVRANAVSLIERHAGKLSPSDRRLVTAYARSRWDPGNLAMLKLDRCGMRLPDIVLMHCLALL